MRKQNVLLYPVELAAPFVAKWEADNKPKLTAYKCPAGKWTIGFGHTKNVFPGETITKEEAYRLLEEDLENTKEDLARLIHIDITENEFVALMSFVFNFGLTKCRRYTLFKKINAQDVEGIKEWWPKYVNPGSKFEDGLRMRRNAELELFFRK